MSIQMHPVGARPQPVRLLDEPWYPEQTATANGPTSAKAGCSKIEASDVSDCYWNDRKNFGNGYNCMHTQDDKGNESCMAAPRRWAPKTYAEHKCSTIKYDDYKKKTGIKTVRRYARTADGGCNPDFVLGSDRAMVPYMQPAPMWQEPASPDEGDFAVGPYDTEPEQALAYTPNRAAYEQPPEQAPYSGAYDNRRPVPRPGSVAYAAKRATKRGYW